MLPILNTTENYILQKGCKKRRVYALYALNLSLYLPPALLWHISDASVTGVYFFLYRFLFFHPGEICIIELKKIIDAALTLKSGDAFLSLIEQEAAMPIHHMHAVES